MDKICLAVISSVHTKLFAQFYFILLYVFCSSSIFLLTSTRFICMDQVGNAAIIVDPSSTQIIAKATDQTHQHDTSEEGNNFSKVRADDTCPSSETTDNDGNLLLPRSYLSKPNSLNMEVSCINLWGWTKQRTMEQKPLPGEGCFAWHPLRHAAMVAVENAAERDRTMFPSSTSITKPGSNCNLENYNEPAKRLKADTKVSLIACWHKILIAITYLLFYETSNDAYSFLYFFF